MGIYSRRFLLRFVIIFFMCSLAVFLAVRRERKLINAAEKVDI